MPSERKELAVWGGAFSGFCAILIGLGLARFGYAPLIPALVSADWFTTSQADYLDAANFLGYLAGTLFSAHMQRIARPAVILRTAMLVTAACFIACAFKDTGFIWTMVWRFISGSSGAACMVFAAPTVLAVTPERLRGIAGGVVFAGIGGGIIVSATLLPALIDAGGPQAAWLGLAAVAFVLTAAAWAGWPKEAKETEQAERRKIKVPFMVHVLFLVYGLFAAGLVPHMIFLVDYIEDGLKRGVEAGSHAWLVYGIGATVVAPIIGRLSDRFGVAKVLHTVVVINIAAVGMPLVASWAAWLGLSAFIVGGFTVTIAALILGRLHQLVPDRREQYHLWGFATAAFATGQAASAYLNSYLFSAFGSFLLLFAVGAAFTVVALIVDLGGYYRSRAEG